uniref:Uncharacterized protein n=1 Tax=Panagrolaimus superbus TaxID=310955 RepID=A0A914YXW9_9BILA
MSNDSIGIQFYSNYTTSEWEPQFISSIDVPQHDETFFYPLKDNTVLVSFDLLLVHYKLMKFKEMGNVSSRLQLCNY